MFWSAVPRFLALAALPFLVAAAPADNAGPQCEALRQVDFSQVVGAPARILSVKLSEGTAGRYCEVEGYVPPRVQFSVRLPVDRWNGKLLFQGCGGFCGQVDLTRADDALTRGYTVATTDMGHRSAPLDGLWAYQSPEAKRDFAERATHVATTAAKAVIAHFYGRGPERSYFRGCSTGGRQGLIAAQRYPADYDGIIAGAPPLSYLRGTGVQLLWSVKAGRALEPADVRLLYASVMKVCDGTDGRRDGLIADPRRCRFDPRRLACGTKRGGTCLSPAKIEAIERIYRGPVDSRGEPVSIRGPELGSELNWIGTYVGTDGRPALYEAFVGDLFRYLAFVPEPGPSWSIDDFDFDTDPARLAPLDQLYSADDPNLAAFAARGGKLIHYHGWSDQSVVPATSLAYAARVASEASGDGAAMFYRLFMIPGLDHCVPSAGIAAIDYLSALESWVERGEAPERIVVMRKPPAGESLTVRPEHFAAMAAPPR